MAGKNDGRRRQRSYVRRPTSDLRLDFSPSRLLDCQRLLLGLLLLAGVMVGAAPVGADVELGSAGNIGGHGLIDSRESPGATCRFAPPLDWSLGETWIQVRPPVMFARDATTLVDQQLVGWRAVILTWDQDSGAWTPIARGATQRALAAENRAAVFDSRGPETQFHLGYGRYLVTLELFWYERMASRDEPRLAGQTTNQIEHYAIAVRDRRSTWPQGVGAGCWLLN